jgi:hypothetical protein
MSGHEGPLGEVGRREPGLSIPQGTPFGLIRWLQALDATYCFDNHPLTVTMFS